MRDKDGKPPPILPLGTAIVSRVQLRAEGGLIIHPAGSMGVIVKAPTDQNHSYRVRLPDGGEVSVRRGELFVFKEFQKQGLRATADALVEYGLDEFVIYRCVVGSRAYGLDEAESDTDRRGIYLPPADLHWSIYGAPEQFENSETEECYWELHKFLLLALKANPNVYEVLYSPLVEYAAPLAEELLALKSIFLSKLVFQTYNGYVMSQFRKIEQDLRNRGQIKWKHAMHLVRLLISGVTILREGIVPVRVEAHRDRLLAIRRGEVAWEEINAWRQELHKEFETAFTLTRLPERPDYARANQFLIDARRSMVSL